MERPNKVLKEKNWQISYWETTKRFSIGKSYYQNGYKGMKITCDKEELKSLKRLLKRIELT